MGTSRRLLIARATDLGEAFRWTRVVQTAGIQPE